MESSEKEESLSSLSEFQELLREWEAEHGQQNYDPTSLLERMAEILEREANVYMASDPDPFEERHPCRVDPDCQFGLILKAYFKKESLVHDVFGQYMKDNYFTRSGLDQTSFSLNVAACRLVLDILPGLEVAVLNDTEGLVSQLYKWIAARQEPLASYATGLLAVAMELNEVATDTEIRERNSRLVPEMLSRLKELQEKADKERLTGYQERFKRPFALFSKSPHKAPRRSSSDGDQESGPGRRSLESKAGQLAPGWPGSLLSPPRVTSAENSNSSWAEMELDVIGHYDIFPLTLQASQIFILRLLTPLAEYQDFLSFSHEKNILEILEKYINVRESRDARLAFEGLRLLASLFCHKKFTQDWVARGGLSLLLQLPRPSMAATGSSLCLYYLACDDDTMERICSMSTAVLRDLVKFCLWLLECSHETGRQYSIMFFGLAFSFRTMLEIFDSCDGLRRLYNTISTLSIVSEKNDDRQSLTDDQEFSQRQSVRYTVQALKKYFEAHLAMRVEDELNRDLTREGGSPQPPHPHNRPYRLEADQVSDQIFTLLELQSRRRWAVVDQFVQLGGVSMLIQVIALSYDWSWPGRVETVRAALDTLAVTCVSLRVQGMLCNKFELPEESVVGISLILGAAEAEIVPESPEVQKAALQVLCYLLCGPLARSSNMKVSHTPTPTKRSSRTSRTDDVICKVWECVRENNGIMTLLTLIQSKTPLTDADSVRALACRALVGLARSATATQIMSKLAIFNNGVLNMLLREPVLQDKRAEHVKFQKYAHQLMERVSGPVRGKNYDNNDISLEMLHRASVVANTKIRYNDKQLLQLIHEHLVMSGLYKTADLLRSEAEIVPLVDSGQFTGQPPVYPARSMISFHPSHLNRRQSRHPPVFPPSSLPSRSAVSTPSRPAGTPSRTPARTPGTPAQTNPLQLRVVRPGQQTGQSSSTPARSAMKTTADTGEPVASKLDTVEESKHEVSLVSIVSDYLAGQHALCKNPMTTCPEFDLFLPHKCPDKRSRRDAPLNFTVRHGRKSYFPPHAGPDGKKLDRKLIYSRFRPFKTFRAEDEDREDNILTCAAFSADRQFIYAGTVLGDVKMFNISSGEETTYQCHESYINHIEPSNNSKLVITSANWRLPYSKIWTIGEFFEEKMSFREEECLEFSKVLQDKVVGTCAEGVATIWDLNTSQRVRTLTPTNSNAYTRNKATFDPTDDLVLSDGVLWDQRMPRQIHKFDKLNQTLSGVFHPNGLEIISNTEVWDIRTFHLLRQVPQLDQTTVVFTHDAEVMYAVNLDQEVDDDPKFETAFKTFDASDYSLIATIETKKSVLGVCPSWDDSNVAVIEQCNGDVPESVVRLYEVGMLRAEEEEQEEDEDEGNESPGDDDDDDDDDTDGSSIISGFLDGDGNGDYDTGSATDNDDEEDDDDMDENSDVPDDVVAALLDGHSGDGDDGNDSWEDIDVQEENL